MNPCLKPLTYVVTWLIAGAQPEGLATVYPGAENQTRVAMQAPNGSRSLVTLLPNPKSELGDSWLRPLRQLSLDRLEIQGRVPADQSGRFFVGQSERPVSGDLARRWEVSNLSWVPSGLVHQPLYFSDVPLERYGQTSWRHLQPAVSGARFFGTLPILPYLIGSDPPGTLVSTLGRLRPGSDVPCLYQGLPHSGWGALLESGAWVGLVLLLP